MRAEPSAGAEARETNQKRQAEKSFLDTEASQAAENYSHAWQPHAACSVRSKSCLRPVASLFLQFSLFHTKNAYLVPVPSLYSGIRQLVF